MVGVMVVVVRREEGAAGEGGLEAELFDFGYDIDREVLG